MNAFTARKVAEGKALYEAMCKPKGTKGAIPNRSIHPKWKVKGSINREVWGQGYPYHGHVNA
jgi:hypothetical protein